MGELKVVVCDKLEFAAPHNYRFKPEIRDCILYVAGFFIRI